MSFSPGAALILHALLAVRAFAASTNITVDDTNSTIWTFVGGWSAVTPSTPCSGCFAQPDPSQAYNSSWHDGSVVSGSVTFQGSAIYIYGIDMTATSGTNISFSMNNPSTAAFHYFGGTGTTYNVPFFSATNLDPSQARTVSFIGQTSLTGAGAMLFDYAIITMDQQASVSSSHSSSASSSTSSAPSSSTPTLTPTQKSKTGAIVGAVVGVVGGLAILGGGLLLLRRHRKRRSSSRIQMDIDAEDDYEGPGGITGFMVEPYQPVPTEPPRETSFVGAPLSPSEMSTLSSRPPTTSRLDSKSAQAGSAGDPNAARTREAELEERLHQLEALVHPPQYSAN
ncbi:hypothetical protein DFH06DRAFT_1135727 [Mycena polygramma]|nr:hypothetical protein DFH06DRAFT_1135727 [Mycena polygramma]